MDPINMQWMQSIRSILPNKRPQNREHKHNEHTPKRQVHAYINPIFSFFEPFWRHLMQINWDILLWLTQCCFTQLNTIRWINDSDEKIFDSELHRIVSFEFGFCTNESHFTHLECFYILWKVARVPICS